jgi:hypothetical protein
MGNGLLRGHSVSLKTIDQSNQKLSICKKLMAKWLGDHVQTQKNAAAT